MDIQTREALITEINNFKKEALKMHIVEVLANTYEHSSLFDCNIDVDGSVIWYKAQARQLWDFWQAAKAQAVPEWNSVDDKEPPLGTMVLICWSDAPDVEPEKDYMDHDVDHGVNYWANYNDGDEPSHWMLLPKPVAREQKG